MGMPKHAARRVGVRRPARPVERRKAETK